MKSMMWKRIIAIGITAGMLATSLSAGVSADDTFIEEDTMTESDEGEDIFVPESFSVDGEDVVADEGESFIVEEIVSDEDEDSGLDEETSSHAFIDETEVEMQAASANTATSGTCGENGNNLTWVIDSAGTLTISGSGKMKDYVYGDTSGEVSPFYDRDDILNIIIANGVTSIGADAFDRCRNLTGITIPNSVVSIGSYAFIYCGFTDVTLPNSVASIGDFAFIGCKKLKSINIPNSTTRIGESLFAGCDNLTKVIIPNSVTSIGPHAFDRCINLATIEIPNSVTSIGDSAFIYCDLKSITIPDSVTSMDNGVFAQCKNLESITISNSLETISPVTFAGTSLKSVAIPNGVKSIGDSVFSGCTSLTDITIPESVKSIGINTFYNCTSLMEITIPSTVNTIGQHAFGYSSVNGEYIQIEGFENLRIIGYSGSEAERYAQENGITFVDPSLNIYNLKDETYSFENYDDYDSLGHCFGMSMTSAGYYNDLLDIGIIGGDKNTPLYSFRFSNIVKKPICYYQKIQDEFRDDAMVAGGTFYLTRQNDIISDWREVVNYVKNHEYDGTGILQIGFRQGKYGHAINFLRYENVNGQDRIYAYDNNYPYEEVYFYQDSYGNVYEAPEQTFYGAIDCIALRDIRKYFSSAASYDATHALYMAENAASVQGYTYSYMEGITSDAVYVMYVIPEDIDKVTIIPEKDNATFKYMDQEYSFGAVDDETYGVFKLASTDEGSTGSNESFKIYNEPAKRTPKKATVTEKITISKKLTIKKPTPAKGKITVKWKHFKHTSKKTKKIWKKIKKVQVQCATDKTFKNKVKDVKIGRGKTKYAIKGLKKKTTYYVRVRYFDGTGYSAWSKVKKVKTK